MEGPPGESGVLRGGWAGGPRRLCASPLPRGLTPRYTRSWGAAMSIESGGIDGATQEETNDAGRLLLRRAPSRLPPRPLPPRRADAAPLQRAVAALVHPLEWHQPQPVA